MPRVALLHWKSAEAAPYTEALAAAGHHVVHVDNAASWRSLRDNLPEAVVIHLGRLPSHGREVGVALRSSGKTRHVPIVFVDGEAKKSHYRKFRIRNGDTPNDVAAIREMIERRFLRAAAAHGEEVTLSLQDMSLGIDCLATDNPTHALDIARRLDELNRERRGIESTMREQADAIVETIDVGERCSLSLFDPAWHQGVLGIVAGRLKDRHHRPVFVFARADGTELRGSGRSIPGLQIGRAHV